jgi:hypothetical protein
MLVYNPACSESLSGRTTDAIDHLRRAIAASENHRADARADPRLRPDPRRAIVPGADRRVSDAAVITNRAR